MAERMTLEAYRRDVWSAVGALWPNFGETPERLIVPYVPVLPTFLDESFQEGRTAEWAAQELTVFFLRIYVENALSPDERKARLADLHQLTQRTFDEIQRLGVLPFTAAVGSAHQTAHQWVADGKLDKDRVGLLHREVILALAGKESDYISPIGRIMLRES
jgi:hypothetical protein